MSRKLKVHKENRPFSVSSYPQGPGGPINIAVECGDKRVPPARAVDRWPSRKSKLWMGDGFCAKCAWRRIGT